MYKKIIRWLLHFSVKKEIQRQQYALGINSYINKGAKTELHIIMLDYDTMDFNRVLQDCYELTSFWKLSDFELYTTKHGVHCYWWFDHVPYSRLKMIIDYSKCDSSYKYISRFYDYKTLRTTGKYIRQDIVFAGRFCGVRRASPDELELGNLKKREYLLLKNMKVFKDEVLKNA